MDVREGVESNRTGRWPYCKSLGADGRDATARMLSKTTPKTAANYAGHLLLFHDEGPAPANTSCRPSVLQARFKPQSANNGSARDYAPHIFTRNSHIKRGR